VKDFGGDMDKQANPADYYAILQVRPDAQPEVIRAAYYGLLTKYHFAADPLPDAARKIEELKEAYEVLADPAKRALYDAGRASASDNQENFASTVAAKSVSLGGRWVLTIVLFVACLSLPLWLAPDISDYLAAAFASITSGDLPVFFIRSPTWLDEAILSTTIGGLPVFLLLWFWANFLAAAFMRFGAGYLAGFLAVYGTSRISPARRLEVAGWAFGIVEIMALVIVLRAANPETTLIDGVSTLLLLGGAAFGAWYGYHRIKGLDRELREKPPDPPDPQGL
jgi:hypothetical protein